jgi:mannose-6-phosphate isomerase
MRRQSLYPLRFEPIFQHRIWGGRRLADWFARPLPGDGPIGEAWVLSDRDDHPSRVAEGPLEGVSLPELMRNHGPHLLGPAARHHRRFPLLLKFLDARETLSVQVHPSDHHAHLLPPGERGKTEAWVVLEATPDSRVYVGLRPGTTRAELHRGLHQQRLEEHLHSFSPAVGDCIFLPAGVVHALGGGIVLFEIQQNSDVTFRLHDWNRRDPKTDRPRDLHIEQALACTNFTPPDHGLRSPCEEQGTPSRRERLVSCDHFHVWRWQSQAPFMIGAREECRIVVCLAGSAQLVHEETEYAIRAGDVLLLPAEIGVCGCKPAQALTLLECGLSDVVGNTKEAGEMG